MKATPMTFINKFRNHTASIILLNLPLYRQFKRPLNILLPKQCYFYQSYFKTKNIYKHNNSKCFQKRVRSWSRWVELIKKKYIKYVCFAHRL